MMNEPRKTAHQMRIEQVRERMTKVIAKLEQPRRRGGLTKYGVFAERAWGIALEKGIHVSKASETTTTGVPKDLVSGVRKLALGLTGAHGNRLDVYELACITFEQEARERRAEARQHLTVVGSTPEAPEAVTGQENATEMALAVTAEFRETLGYTPPTEFDAAKTISEVLSDFDTRTALRILDYMNTHIRQRSGDDA